MRTYSDEVTAFKSDMGASGSSYSPETIEKYGRWLQRIIDTVQPKSLKEFDNSDWLAFNTWINTGTPDEPRGPLSFTYNYGMKIALKSYWEDYCKFELRKKKPFFKLPKKKDYASVDRSHEYSERKDKSAEVVENSFHMVYDISPEKIHIKLEISDRNRAMLILNYFAAARRGEVQRMRVEDLDFENKLLTIRDTKTRTIGELMVPEDRFWVSMGKYLKSSGIVSGPLFVATSGPHAGGAMHKDTISRIVKKTGTDVFGADVWSHFLRYFRLSELGKILPPDQLSQYGRHKNIDTTMQYYRSKGIIQREMYKNLQQKKGDDL